VPKGRRSDRPLHGPATVFGGSQDGAQGRNGAHGLNGSGRGDGNFERFSG